MDSINRLLGKAREIGTRIQKSLSEVMVVILVISFVSLLMGYILYRNSFSAYEIKSQSTTGIIFGRYPYQSWKITFFDFLVDPQANKLYLNFWFEYESNGSYSIALALPFRIESVRDLTPSPDEGNWTWRNADSGSVVMVTFNAEGPQYGIGHQRVSAEIDLRDPIADKIFEVHSINLPFGGSFTLDVQKEWDNLRSIAPISPTGEPINCSLDLALPSSAMITSITHSIARRDPAKENQQLFEFKLTSVTPFFIQYSVPEERYSRESNLFFSGILISFGISGFMVVIGIIEERLRKKPKHQMGQSNSYVLLH